MPGNEHKGEEKVTKQIKSNEYEQIKRKKKIIKTKHLRQQTVIRQKYIREENHTHLSYIIHPNGNR